MFPCVTMDTQRAVLLKSFVTAVAIVEAVHYCCVYTQSFCSERLSRQRESWRERERERETERKRERESERRGDREQVDSIFKSRKFIRQSV